jgi:hypothetical protein
MPKPWLRYMNAVTEASKVERKVRLDKMEPSVGTVSS